MFLVPEGDDSRLFLSSIEPAMIFHFNIFYSNCKVLMLISTKEINFCFQFPKPEWFKKAMIITSIFS